MKAIRWYLQLQLLPDTIEGLISEESKIKQFAQLIKVELVVLVEWANTIG